MDEESVAQYILALPDVRFDTSPDGARFFFYGEEKMFPFATLVNSDAHDQVSNLDRPGAFRLNIGVSRETFLSLFPDKGSADYDYTAADVVMPHPDYGRLFWVCIVNPSEATFDKARGLLGEAYDAARAKQARRDESERRREGEQEPRG
ncbi:MAG TPA: DUF6194 family protein [Actinomycetota bacterium]|nr:DUF6194 family protein [Actinomycetota bacterium]